MTRARGSGVVCCGTGDEAWELTGSGGDVGAGAGESTTISSSDSDSSEEEVMGTDVWAGMGLLGGKGFRRLKIALASGAELSFTFGKLFILKMAFSSSA